MPDAPTSFENDATITEESIIGLKWQDGVSNGGTPVIDYKLWYKHELDTDFEVLEQVIVS